MPTLQNKIKYFDNFSAEINDECKIRQQKFGDLDLIIIDDFLVNPDKTTDNFMNIPFDMGQTVLENESRRDESEGRLNFVKPMGENQVIHPNLVHQLMMHVHNFLKECDFIPMNSSEQQTPEQFTQMMGTSNWTGNYFYPDMTISTNKQKCHPGNYMFNAQLFLSKEAEGEENGVTFYTFNYENKVYWTVQNLMQECKDAEERRDIMDLLNYKYVPQPSTQKFEQWEGDENFQQVFKVGAKYNRLIIFPGTTWYQVNYDNTNEKYFIEGNLHIPGSEENGPGPLDSSGGGMPMETMDYE